MGYVRFFLAISVVFSHGFVTYMVGGRLAVQLFFMISGFLMSYVLNESNKYELKHVFYRSRFLRIFPIYFVVASATLVYFLIHDSVSSIAFFDVYSNSGVVATLMLVLANLLIFLQDVVMFFRTSPDGLTCVSNFREFDQQLWRGLLVPQAWTLSLELIFYLIFPFIFNKRKTIVVIFLVSLFLKGFFVMSGIGRVDPWSYRFFPFEICWFLLGALSHIYVFPIFNRRKTSKVAPWIVSVCCFAICFFHFLPYKLLFSFIFLFIFSLLLPILFSFRSRLDSFLGALSFPIYICHMLVIYVIYEFAGVDDYKEADILSFSLVISVVLCLSYLLERYIGVYFDKLRFSKIPSNVKVKYEF